MPSEPSDGIFDAPPFTGTGQVRGNTRNRHCRYTVTLKPVIPAQAGIRTPDAAGNLSEMTETTRGF
ncbi:hypothetical protein [Neisseria gonorrhoeae]|uniref:hypothetical protein n=1 Tax=Neisseria gonorrhoeae TaxID=485 RepID=UPI00272A549F|nr:hypothetical protein [Neisseria gonorrhoeae]WLF12938.1 hypothetical protein Q6379_09580 [Neisseria gonorrhoeae]